MEKDNLFISRPDEDGVLQPIGKYKPRKKKRTKKHTFYLMIAENIASTDIIITSISQIILLQMDSNNRIIIDSVLVSEWAKKYKKAEGTFWSTLNRMVKEGSLLKESAGHYFANPFYFTKASDDKADSLRIEWGQIREKQFQAEIMKTKAVDKHIMKQTREILNEQKG